jgi:hypothetical protein
LRRVLAPGWNAVVKNWRPFLAIQITCALLVAGYYTIPGIENVCGALAQMKRQGGLSFSALSVAIAAVALPEIARRATKAPRDKPLSIGDLVFQGTYFAILGISIDTLYRGLGIWLGDDPTPTVVLQKVLFDMVVFSGVFSMPLAVVLFAWRDADFSWREGIELLRRGGFMERYVPLLITCWAFWSPVMACLYSLPVDLQFVFAVLAEAAWCLLLVTAASRVPEVDKIIA